MNDLNTVSKVVEYILETNRQARNSDSYLYLRVLEHFADKNGLNLQKVSVPIFLLNMDSLGLPAFETVRRTRQKVQQHHPELASSKKIAAYRAMNEQVFREFARGEL